MATLPALSEAEWGLLRDLVDEGAMSVGPEEALTERLQAAGLIRVFPSVANDIFVAPTGLGFRALQPSRGPRARRRQTPGLWF